MNVEGPLNSPLTAPGGGSFAKILDGMAVGAAVFNAQLEMVDCNDLFLHAHHYPVDLCQRGTSLEAFLRYEADNGQLIAGTSDDFVDAWLRRARQRIRCIEQQPRANGRIFDMTLVPIQAGGVALTFADVTERELTERAMRKTHDWHELVSEASSEGLYDWDIPADLLTVSYRLTGMLGLDPGELHSEDWAKIIHPDDDAAYRDALIAHFRGETPSLKVEYRIRRKSGEYVWFADSGKCVRNNSGKAIRLVGAVADITSRKLIEAALRTSEERFTLAMEAINEGIYDWDLTTNEIYFSTGVRAALGLHPHQLKTPEDWYARIHPGDQQYYRDTLINHFKGLTDRFECEVRYDRGDGIWRHARQHGVARFDADGRAVRMVGSTGDISELVAHRNAAVQAQSDLAKAIDSISDGFAIYDSGDHLVLCNKHYRALFPGVEDLLVVGVRYETVMRAMAEREVLMDVGGDIDGWIAERLAMRNNAEGTYVSQLTDGRWANVAWRRTQDGGLVGVLSDITALKRAELAMRESEERYALATAAATEGLYDWDVVRNRLVVSDRLNKIMSLQSKDLNSSEWNDRVHPRDRDHYRDAITSHFKGISEYLAAEYRIRTGDSNYIWVSDSASSVRDPKGRVIRLVGAITDISERKKAEQALREAKLRADNASPDYS
jgi:PAS domain S-box-containing protein